MQEKGFWDDIKRAEDVTKESKSIKDKIDRYESLVSRLDDVEILAELAEEAGKNYGISTAAFNTPTSLNYGKDYLGAGFSATTNAIGGLFGGGNNSLLDSVLNMDLSNYRGRNPQQDSRPIKIDNHYGMTIDPGAIQINVTNTGDGTIDEYKLAQQIKTQLLDLQREQRVRSGNLRY